jgi:hypothetical protein
LSVDPLASPALGHELGPNGAACDGGQAWPNKNPNRFAIFMISLDFCVFFRLMEKT